MSGRCRFIQNKMQAKRAERFPFNMPSRPNEISRHNVGLLYPTVPRIDRMDMETRGGKRPVLYNKIMLNINHYWKVMTIQFFRCDTPVSGQFKLDFYHNSLCIENLKGDLRYIFDSKKEKRLKINNIKADTQWFNWAKKELEDIDSMKKFRMKVRQTI